MASIESLLEQVSKSDLGVAALVRLRAAIDQRLVAASEDLDRQRAAIEAALSSIGRAKPGRPAKAPRAAVAASAPSAPAAPAGRRKRRAGGAGGAGKHAGLSVADAVRKVIGKGNKMSAAQIKKAFNDAGDKRILNFTILARGGVVKRVGLEKKEPGSRGRAGGIYSLV
jgi:hypothetical protein